MLKCFYKLYGKKRQKNLFDKIMLVSIIYNYFKCF